MQISSNIMKSVVLAGLFLCFLQYDVEATHIVGGNITYRHVTGSMYQIRLTLRRDCGSAENEPFDSNARIGVFDLKSGGAYNIALPLMTSDTLNEFISSDCGFEGMQVCVHQTTYIGFFTLDDPTADYILAYQRCCRNGTLGNILDPLETGATYWTEIKARSVQIQNNSPVFKQWPDVYICANTPLIFDHSATDVDGDSLVYRLCTPSSGASRQIPQPSFPSFPPFNDIQWRNPFDISNMLGGVPLSIDPKTGLLTGNPNAVGQFLVGICMDEYRDGVLLSSTKRDFQYNVRVCSQPPKAAFKSSESDCSGLTVSFTNQSLAATQFEWNFNYPSSQALFRSTEENPVFTYPNSGVYKVYLKAIRGSDLCFDTIIQEVSVYTNQINANFDGGVLTLCNSGSKDTIGIKISDASTINEPGHTINRWEWTVLQNGVTTIYQGSNPTIIAHINGILTITLKTYATNGCQATISKQINPQDFLPKTDFTFDYLGCDENNMAKISLNSLGELLNPKAIVDKYLWQVGNTNLEGNPQTILLPIDQRTVTVRHTTSLGDDCQISLEKTFDLTAIFPSTTFKIAPIECPDANTVTLLAFVDSTGNNGIKVNKYAWQLISGGITNVLEGDTVRLNIPKDSSVNITLQTNFDNACNTTISRIVEFGPFAKLTFNADTIFLCPGEVKPLISNGNPDWTYNWSPMNNLDLTLPYHPLVSGQVNQKYQVTVSDGLCSVTGEVFVVSLEGGIILELEGDNVTCDGDISLTVSGSLGEGQYNWSNTSDFQEIIFVGNVLTLNQTQKTVTYYVNFQGKECSTMPASITVTNEKPEVDKVSPFKICPLDTIRVPLLNEIPLHNNIYTWSPSPYIVNGQNTSSPTIGIGPNVEDFTLYYSVVNQFGCELEDSINFVISTNPVVDFSFTLKECGFYEACFDIIGEFEGFSVWNFGDPTTENDISLEKSPCYTYGEPGIFDVFLVNRVGVCPFEPVLKTIVVNPQITLNNIQDTIICKGDTVGFFALSNIRDAIYSWKDISGVLITNSSFISVSPDKDIVLIYSGVDQNGCTDSDTVTVGVFEFDYSISSNDSLCVNEPTKIQLNINNPQDYIITWSPSENIIDGINTPSPTVLPKEGITYQVVLQHINTGCIDTNAVTPKVTQPIVYDVNTPDVACIDVPTSLFLNIENSQLYNFDWTPKDCFVSGDKTTTPTIKITADKILTVLVTEISSGCKKSLDVPVKSGEFITLNLDVEPDREIFEGTPVTISVINPKVGETYVWSTGERGTSITVSPTVTTTYIVTVTDEDGCEATDEVIIEVRNTICDETDVFIPNAFTPNGDDVNDIFRVQSNVIDELSMIIYNRWGQEVFKTNDLKGGWNGTFNGVDLPPDSYAYYIKVRCINREEYSKRGNVTLLR